MKILRFIFLIVYFGFLDGLISCNLEDNVKSLKKYLDISLPKEISSFNSTYECLDESYKKPCVFFCAFSISKANFSKWIHEVKLPVVDSSFLKESGNLDVQVFNKVTRIDMPDFSKSQKYPWWGPLQCDNQTRYASFYNSKLKSPIMSFKEPWDGRVLIIYCERESRCYLIVETFL